MTPYLQVENLTKSFGDLVLFNGISFGIAEGQRIGLIAKNGSGKTTLLNILAGKEGYDEGKITFRRDLRVGYLEQSPKYPEELTVLEACFYHGNSTVELIKEYERCMETPGNPGMDELLVRMEHEKAWDYERRAKRILSQLKIRDFSQKIGHLSGGQLKRVALANILITEPDLLILDEPTNHLDLDMTEWLEEYLNRGSLSLLMVTHDRYFLDRVCSEIIEIDNRQLYSYKGNYSYYLEKRQERIEATNAEIARANNLYRTELEWMRRMPQARGHKARYREEAFYELEKVAKQRTYDANVKLDVKASYIGSKIFESDHLCKHFGDLKILDDFSYIFARYEKMGIVGNNGTGKSTFIKILMGLEKPDSGTLDIGETVRFGYYSQEGLQFNEQMKVIDVITDIAEVIELGNGKRLTASQFLQHFLFTPETQHSYVYKLSGGERRRLYLCTVLMRNPNFLVLDEPTNDLDIVTLQVLEEYLQNFKGCVIVVSHDRYFMDKVVDHLLVFKGQGDIRDFPGNYSDYRDWKLAKAEHEKEAAKPKEEKTQRVRLNDKRRMTFKERKEFEQLEKEIAALEEEKKQIEEALCSGTLSVDELTEKSKRLPLLNDELDEKTMRWLELSEIEG
ncbi:ABC-F family ATP-binding cassette domain-containing protein [Phocaeicola plebeius]|jgi:ATP-binding cassette subfamily F protein uup|uniref:ATP-binding cassette domain-containing protein n=1 Tax=Phocaeicola plebeius TaxID=310297 RepID=A0A3E4MRY7_9BACT|nr:ABC-F family ATP-binding cassette domain-containing protein [Phocaeicola plebeius]MBD9353627.1 ATP-binding cassette domain-containing protein [Phocaeicola plebeius]RGK52511.1 ATP-binding cassette domain-containing protein [Phocaeicola plebeius]RGM36470.1 ATP-binding cassette domain-containing protein [Phocaeicola plebeius]RGQ69735.1 ATP-binding cassette domain-containing protein [Phocaeicola plebeius]RGQ89568.1 ATP-binding cassette domain-containing protein [Phocaeicola plebeius]